MAGEVTKVLALANALLSHVGMATRVHSLGECNSTLFAQLYEILTGDKVRFLGDSNSNNESSRCQCVVDLLSQQLAGHVSLEHITGVDLAVGDPLSVSNLLDVFSVLFHLHWDGDPDDSNILSQDGMDVISGVLKEEGIGSPCSSYSSVSTADLLCTVSEHSLSHDTTPLISQVVVSPPPLTPSPPHTPLHAHKPLLSPLHHSTPHAATRSRVYNQEPPNLPPPVATIGSAPSQRSCTPPTASLLTDTCTTHQTSEGISAPSVMLKTTDTTHSSLIDESTILSPQDGLSAPSVMLTTADTMFSPYVDGSTILSSPPPPPPPLTAGTQTDAGTNGPPDPGSREAPLDMQAAVIRTEVLENLCQNFVKELRRDNKAKHQKKQRHEKKKYTEKHKHKPTVETRGKPPVSVAVEEPILPLIEGEFPFLHLSPAMLRRLWQQQLRQVAALTRSHASQQQSAAKRVAESQQKHEALARVIKKELEHTRRMKRQLEQQREERAVKETVRSKRQASAQARRYFNDYELRLRAKLQRERTREEQLFRRVFEEALELQRGRVRELRRFAKEKQQEHAKRHEEQLESMENFYQDQFAMLAENMAKERAEVEVRDKARNQLVTTARRQLRRRLEEEVQELQATLEREDDVMHFRELDAGALRHKLAQLSFGK